MPEPPVSLQSPGFSERAPLPGSESEQRRVVIRLSDGETILVGTAPTHAHAVGLARATIAQLHVPVGDWPFVNDRFLRPDSIISVDVLLLA